jgi:hypothetical protein
MANTLPFDSFMIGSEAFEPEDVVYGSGSYNPELQKTAVTTADGYIHNIVTSIGNAASVQVYGDVTETLQADAPSLSQNIVFYVGTTSGVSIADFYGTLSVEYDESSRISTITITGDPA